MQQALATVRQQIQSGRLAEAEALCRSLIERFPGEAEPYHLLGAVAFYVGNRPAALALFEQAIALNPQVAEYHNNRSSVLLDLQRFADAEAAARRALALVPQFAEAEVNLASAVRGQGRLEECVAAYRRALAIRPAQATAANNMGTALAELGRLDEAVAAYQQALAAQPDLAEAHFNLGNALQMQGRYQEALAAFGQALAIRPDFADAACNQGVVLHTLGRFSEAVQAYQRVLAVNPAYTKALCNLGTALLAQGRREEAIATFRRAISIDPADDNAYANLGSGLQNAGHFAEAVEAYRQAIRINPRNVTTHSNLGGALLLDNRLEEAEAACRAALAINPAAAEALDNLGSVLKAQGRLEEAVAAYQQALRRITSAGAMRGGRAEGSDRLLAVHSKTEEVFSNLGVALELQGRLDEAAAAFRRAREINPRFAVAHSNDLFCRQYRPETAPDELAAAHAQWDQQHAAPLRAAWRGWTVDRNPDRRLRLGFVSADLRLHPVGLFLIRAFEALDPQACQTICYSDVAVKDEATARFAAAATAWRDIRGMSDEQLAEQVRADQIDLLFDLGGHTAENRLLTFARKPAPLQITWIGYEGSTGLVAMDYLLADRFLAPDSLEPFCRERVLRMPHTYVCYEPPPHAPDVGPLPAAAGGPLTLGCFNNLAKITPQVISTWAEILRRLPASRLMLKYRGLTDPGTRRRYLELFAAEGVAPERLLLYGWSSRQETLALYGQVDLALDPFPFSGGLTTCEALWMGVPVLTCPGQTFASRHGLSFLSNIGLTDLIARDRSDYVALAVALAGDLPRLAAWRSGLRDQMARSPLCDGKRFAEELMRLLRDVWRRWVGG